MRESYLRRLFNEVNFIELNNTFIIFSDLSLYNGETGEEIYFNNYNELLNHTLSEVETVSDALDKIEFKWTYSGGRGASSNSLLGGGFTSANNNSKKRTEEIEHLYPASFNRQGRYTTVEGTISRFEKMYGKADKEYAISVDNQGFVHKHTTDGSHSSVAIKAMGRGHTIVHNHPSGSAFSSADLKVFARDKNASSIIATGRKATSNGVSRRQRYTISKTSKFDAKGFTKAIKNAKWPAHYDYNRGARWWLKKNEAKYGYKFDFKS